MVFKRKTGRPRKHGTDATGRCGTCGGVDGDHRMIRRSVPIRDKNGVATRRYKFVTEKCPHA